MLNLLMMLTGGTIHSFRSFRPRKSPDSHLFYRMIDRGELITQIPFFGQRGNNPTHPCQCEQLPSCNPTSPCLNFTGQIELLQFTTFLVFHPSDHRIWGDRTDTMLNLLLFVAALIVGFLWCRLYDRWGQTQGMFIIFIAVKSRAHRNEGGQCLPRPVDAAAHRLEGIHGGGKLFIRIRTPSL